MESIIPIGYWIFFIITFAGTFIGLYLLFQKAGVAGWKALVPIYNLYICTKLTGKKLSWFIMLLIPVLNVVIWLLVVIELAKAFGRDTFWAGVAAMMIPYIYFPVIGLDKDVKYIGIPQDIYKGRKKSAGREWADAIAFAVVAATMIRTFFFEAYTIPTTSMESTLKAGDFLFVSKFHYGARFPITPIAFPFAHHTMPLLKTKAFFDVIQLPYMRFPGIENVHRNGSVVFNFPEGDTVYLPMQQNSYYSILQSQAEYDRKQAMNRNETPKPYSYYYNVARRQYGFEDLTYRPIDKRDNYIKRCVGLPGDSIEVVDGILYVNGKKAFVAEHQQKSYQVLFKKGTDTTTAKEFLQDHDLNSMDFSYVGIRQGSALIEANMDIATFNEIKNDPAVAQAGLEHFNRATTGSVRFFPHNPNGPLNSMDDFGPIWVPKKGTTVTITKDNYYNYQRIIEVYEKNTITRDKSGNPMMRGNPLTQYTFKQNYYWMMGDNRHRSYDSRYWGYVPEDHIVGKPVLIWFSWDKTKPLGKRIAGIRWSRMFRFL